MKKILTTILAATAMASAQASQLTNTAKYGKWSTSNGERNHEEAMFIAGTVSEKTPRNSSLIIGFSTLYQCQPILRTAFYYPEGEDTDGHTANNLNIEYRVDDASTGKIEDAYITQNDGILMLTSLLDTDQLGNIVYGDTLRMKLTDEYIERYSLQGSSKSIRDAYSRCMAALPDFEQNDEKYFADKDSKYFSNDYQKTSNSDAKYF